ncbi:MAG: DUF3341 domain-containing protein [Polyangiaceae bacterium]|nr:DUF3341 domain-containing protein [Polyangiaceae bacterium]
MAERVDDATREHTHALVFDDPERALEAVRALKGQGYTIVDVYSPFPVPGMSQALGLRPSRLGFATFVGGVTGLSIAVALQLYTHGRDFPINVGGKDNFALPAIIPVTFELTVLLAGFATFFGLLGRSRLAPGKKVKGPSVWDPRITDDHFVVVVDEADGAFEARAFAALCRELGALRTVVGGRAKA